MDERPPAGITLALNGSERKRQREEAGEAAHRRSPPRARARCPTARPRIRPPAAEAEPTEPRKPAPRAEPESAAEPSGESAREPSRAAAPEPAEADDHPAAPPPPPAVADAPRGAAWGHPFARFEQRWTRLESSLLTFVLLWLILSLVAWVFLNGLCEAVTSTAGTVFRSVLLAIALGLAAWRGTAKQTESRRRDLTLVAMAAGVGLILLWRRAAAEPGAALAFDGGVVDYFGNVKGWLQDGSTLTLLGGLRGLATRLTLWLALLGGSLATASGKHIHVDVVFRFIPRTLRTPVAILNYLFAAAVCFAAVWGFVDHIAITSFGSDRADPATAKIESTSTTSATTPSSRASRSGSTSGASRTSSAASATTSGWRRPRGTSGSTAPASRIASPRTR